MNASLRASSSFNRIWGWPCLLAALSVFGLLSALLGQGGIWWLLSWIALATPLAVIVRCLWRRPPRNV
jgi:hypothetical protein